jgi:hypothetical protein
VTTLSLARARRAARGDEGLSLVEVLTASLLFLLVTSSVMYGVTRTLTIGRNNRERTVATNLAAREVDRARAVQDLAQLDNDTYDQAVGGETYHVLRTASWISKDATSGPCDGGTGKFVAYKRVSVRVTWDRMNGVRPVRSDTIITPGVGSYDPTLGNIAVKVLDRAAATVGGVTVTVSNGSSTLSDVTGDDGCAFFAQLQPGASWTATASSTGFVDQQGVVTPSQTTSVSTGNTTALQFTYDRAATVTATVGDGAHPPVPATLTLANSSLTPSGVKYFVGSGASRTVAGLFPFTAGYTGWLGSCSDADPEAIKPGTTSTPLYPGTQNRGTAATVNPGLSSTLAAKAALVRVVVTLAGVPTPGYSVSAVHVPGDATCPSGESWTLGTTGADGSVGASLPFGQWTIKVNDGGPDLAISLVPTVTTENLVQVVR